MKNEPPPQGMILRSVNSLGSSCIFLVYLRLALQDNNDGADNQINLMLWHG